MLNLRTFSLFAFVAIAIAQPSLKGKINQRGVDFLMKIVEQAFGGYLLDEMLLEEKCHYLSFRTNISSLKLTTLDFGQVVMDQHPASTNLYTLNMKSSLFKFAAKYEIKAIDPYKQTLQTLDGSFTFVNPNVDAHVVAQLNNDDGKGTSFYFSPLKCKVTVDGDTTDIDTSSTLDDDMVKFLRHAIDKTLAEHIESQICSTLVSQSLISSIYTYIMNIPGRFFSYRRVAIDLGLYSNPQVKSHSLEVELNGKCYPAYNQDVSYSYVRHPLPTLENSTIMAQVAIGQYFLETLLDTVVSVGLLKFNVDPSILTLRGTTIDINFFSLIVPDILSFMAGKSLGFHIELVEPPVINIGPSQLNASGNFDFALVGRLPDGTFTQDPADTAVVFTINVNASGNIWIDQDKINGSLSKLDLFFSVKSKSDRIGSVNTQLVNLFVPQIVTTTLLPFINDALAVGIDIPERFGYKFKNADIALVEHAAVLSFDLAPSSGF